MFAEVTTPLNIIKIWREAWKEFVNLRKMLRLKRWEGNKDECVKPASLGLTYLRAKDSTGNSTLNLNLSL